MDEQRAEFEAWAHKTHYNLGVGPNGLYQSGRTSSAWASWQAATQRQQERIAELEAKVSTLTTALSECRDAFPIPEPGAMLEHAWMGAMTDPEDVPEYVKAQVQALSLDAKRVRTSQSRTGFMCLTDFQHELGEASGGISVYADEDDLKKHRNCWKGCGILKVEVVAAIAAGKGEG